MSGNSRGKSFIEEERDSVTELKPCLWHPVGIGLCFQLSLYFLGEGSPEDWCYNLD
jgi:hypothetical protein